MPRKRSPIMTAAKAVMLVLSLVFSCAMPVHTPNISAATILNRLNLISFSVNCSQTLNHDDGKTMPRAGTDPAAPPP